jgi:CheY-like chemotaxis protein
MKSGQSTENRRIVVIDDNASIHDDFRKILTPPQETDSLTHARAALFGEVPTLPPQVQYELDFASQGREGFGLVQTANQRGKPYAVAFVDMRMPPGWDGLETIEHLWYADPDIQVVICTAYSDHPWEDVSRRIGETDRLLILMKPFNSIEVVQLANSLTRKWNLTRAVKMQVDSLAFSVSQRTAELQAARQHLQDSSDDKTLATKTNPSRNKAEETLREQEEYLAIMSHEILTPMDELRGKMNLLLDSSLSLEQRNNAVSLQRSMQDLLALMNDLHGFMGNAKPDGKSGNGYRNG